MPYLIVPTDDPHLKLSFLAAQREHETVDGHADAGGLTVDDLSGRTCFGHYSTGLRNGTSMRPGTEPLRTCEWWWIEPGPDGPEYMGRVSVRHHPSQTGGHLNVGVRPSRRRQSHGAAMLAAVLPLIASQGVSPILLACDAGDQRAQRLIASVRAELISQNSARHRYRVLAGNFAAAN